MANAVINTVIVEEPAQEIVIIKKKRSPLKKRLIITEDLGPVATPLHEEVITPQKSIWLQMRRTPKVVCPTIVWEGIEDISDDEDNSPQTAGRNLSKMKQTRDRIRHRQYAIKVDELQGAGLFLNWGKYFE